MFEGDSVKYCVNATEVFIEFICSRVCIFNYVSIFVLNVVYGRVRFKTSKFMHTRPKSFRIFDKQQDIL